MNLTFEALKHESPELLRRIADQVEEHQARGWLGWFAYRWRLALALGDEPYRHKPAWAEPWLRVEVPNPTVAVYAEGRRVELDRGYWTTEPAELLLGPEDLRC